MSTVHGNLHIEEMNHFQMYHEGNMGMNNMQTGWFSVRNYAQEYYV